MSGCERVETRLLLKVLSEPEYHSSFVWEVLCELYSRGDASAIPQLSLLLKNKKLASFEREKIVEIIGLFDCEDAVKALFNALDEGEWEIFSEALLHLEKIYRGTNDKSIPEQLKSYIDNMIAKQEKDIDKLLAICLSLHEMGMKLSDTLFGHLLTLMREDKEKRASIVYLFTEEINDPRANLLFDEILKTGTDEEKLAILEFILKNNLDEKNEKEIFQQLLFKNIEMSKGDLRKVFIDYLDVIIKRDDMRKEFLKSIDKIDLALIIGKTITLLIKYKHYTEAYQLFRMFFTKFPLKLVARHFPSPFEFDFVKDFLSIIKELGYEHQFILNHTFKAINSEEMPPGIKARLVTSLGRDFMNDPRCRQQIQKLLHSQTLGLDEKLYVACYLTTSGDKSAKKYLIERLQGETDEIICEKPRIYYTMIKIMDTTENWLKKLLEHLYSEAGELSKEEVICVLGRLKIKSPEVINALIDVYEKFEGFQRKKIVLLFFGYVGINEAEDFLLRVANGRNWVLAEAAIWSLGQIKSQKAKETLEEILSKSPLWRLKMTAKDALMKISNEKPIDTTVPDYFELSLFNRCVYW